MLSVCARATRLSHVHGIQSCGSLKPDIGLKLKFSRVPQRDARPRARSASGIAPFTFSFSQESATVSPSVFTANSVVRALGAAGTPDMFELVAGGVDNF